MAKVILIGGSPMTGKTTIAIDISSKLPCACISTDDIGVALQTVIPIDPMRGKDYRDYYAQTPLSQLMTDARQYHQAMSPAINRLIAIHSTWGDPLVMEGWAVYPSLIQSLNHRNVSSIWRIASDALLEQRMMERPDFLKGKAAENYLARSMRHNRLLLEECRTRNARCIRIDGNESAVSLAGHILNQI